MAITLKAARVNVELTQSQAANKIGVDKATIINWEKNRTSPPADKLTALCRIYGVNIDDIFLPCKLT